MASPMTARQSKQILFRVIRSLRNILPDYLLIYTKVVEISVRNTHPSEYGLENAARILKVIAKRYKGEILAKMLNLFVERNDLPYFYESFREIADMFVAGKDQSISRANSFAAMYPCFELSDLPDLVKGIESFGEGELVQAVKMVPEQDWVGKDEEETAQVRKVFLERHQREYAIIAARLGGVARLLELINFLIENGLGQQTIYFCTATIAERRIFDSDEDDTGISLRIIKNTVEVIKSSKYRSHSWFFNIFHLLERQEASKSELREILWLAQKYGVEEIDAQNFRIAVQFFRRYSTAIYVLESFRTHKTGCLTFALFGFRVGRVGIGLREKERAEFLSLVEEELHFDVSFAALKFLHRRHTAQNLSIEERQSLAQITITPKMRMLVSQEFGIDIPELTHEDSPPGKALAIDPARSALLAREAKIYQRVYHMMHQRITTDYVPS